MNDQGPITKARPKRGILPCPITSLAVEGENWWGGLPGKAVEGHRSPGRCRAVRPASRGAKRPGVRQPSGAFDEPEPGRYRSEVTGRQVRIMSGGFSPWSLAIGHWTFA